MLSSPLLDTPPPVRTGPRAQRSSPLDWHFLPVTRSCSSHRFCNWKTNHSYFQYSGKKFKHRKSPRLVSKFPPGSGGKLHHDTRSLANESREGKARDRRAEGKTSREEAVGRRGGRLTRLALREALRCILSAAVSAGKRVPHPRMPPQEYLPECLWHGGHHLCV